MMIALFELIIKLVIVRLSDPRIEKNSAAGIMNKGAVIFNLFASCSGLQKDFNHIYSVSITQLVPTGIGMRMDQDGSCGETIKGIPIRAHVVVIRIFKGRSQVARLLGRFLFLWWVMVVTVTVFWCQFPTSLSTVSSLALIFLL